MISAEKGIAGFACLFNAEICLAAIEIDVSLTIIDSVVNRVYSRSVQIHFDSQWNQLRKLKFFLKKGRGKVDIVS